MCGTSALRLAHSVLVVSSVCPQRHNASVESFIEELVVRRELSDNHCFYNARYDSLDGASSWARETLLKHAADPRSHLYTLGQFECGVTHDPLWNAAQLQMVNEGKMHGFLRMCQWGTASAAASPLIEAHSLKL